MKCPFCFFLENKVVNSRLVGDGISIKRRRQCLRCKKRFTTHETVQEIQLMVVKRDGRRELFDRNKILTGIRKACEKRPISTEKILEVVETIEQKCKNKFGKEINKTIEVYKITNEFRNMAKNYGKIKKIR